MPNEGVEQVTLFNQVTQPMLNEYPTLPSSVLDPKPLTADFLRGHEAYSAGGYIGDGMSVITTVLDGDPFIFALNRCFSGGQDACERKRDLFISTLEYTTE
jgi:hypothetical protein